MRKTVVLVLVITTLVLFLPILSNPNLILGRHNDLQEFSMPIINFTKTQIIQNKTFPLWINSYLAGTPLLPDPQSRILYLPNIVFLLFPVNMGYIISLLVHTLIAGIAVYLLSLTQLNFSKKASTLAAILYILTPRLAAYLEAGHFGLAVAHMWIPLIALTTIKLSKKPNLSNSILLAISLSGLFYAHLVAFVWAAGITPILFIFSVINQNKNLKIFKPVAYFLISTVLTFGLTAVLLLPLVSWLPQTTRLYLAQNPQVFPLWKSKTELISSIFIPWVNGKQALWSLDTEKWIVIGVFQSSLAIIGFISLKKYHKLIIFLSVFTIFILATNNLSPFYHILLGQKWYSFGRVSTRPWFVLGLFASLLAAYAFDILQSKKKYKFAIKIFTVMATIELLFLSWTRINKPINPTTNTAPLAIYEFLSSDNEEHFRVFCISVE